MIYVSWIPHKENSLIKSSTDINNYLLNAPHPLNPLPPFPPLLKERGLGGRCIEPFEFV